MNDPRPWPDSPGKWWCDCVVGEIVQAENWSGGIQILYDNFVSQDATTFNFLYNSNRPARFIKAEPNPFKENDSQL